jgi:hypothetical protein
MNSEYKGEIVKIANQSYRIRITFCNSISKPFFVPFKVVEGLVIEEGLVNWWTQGWIVLQNDFEVLERGSLLSYKPDNNTENYWQRPLFYFRNDGRNKINIRIETISDDPKVKDETWTMDYDFVIYDVEDIESSTAIKKLKKFYFIDERYQIFNERNIPWSTATHGPAKNSKKPLYQLTDEERKMSPNEAIRSIIETAGCSTFTGNARNQINVGYDAGGSIDNPNIGIDSIDEKIWNLDRSSPSDSNIFYTSPANSNILKDLDFLINHAKGTDGDPIFLRLNRFNKKWELVSLVDYFRTAKQIERLVLYDGLEPKTSAYVPRADIIENSNNNVINFTSGQASLLRNYKFCQMAPIDDLRFKNRPLHKFNFSDGTYSIYFEQNKIETLYDKIKEFATTGGLYSFASSSSPQLWMNINKTKMEGLCTENNFLTQGSSDLNFIRMVKDFVFLNQGLYFQNEGLTHRTPGNFIFIDRMDSSDKNLFDDKFLGQWFITKVIHYFDKQKYVTDVFSSKIDGLNKHWEVVDSK